MRRRFVLSPHGARTRRVGSAARIALLAAAAFVPVGAQAGPADDAETLRGPWSGAVYRVERDGRTKSLVGPQGERYATPQEMVEAEALRVDPLRRSLTGDLADLARDAARAAEPVLVTAIFREQPLHAAGVAARARHADEVASLLARSRAILGRIGPLRTVGANGERAQLGEILDEEARLLTQSEKDELRANRDRLLAIRSAARAEVLAEATPAVDASQAAVRAFLESVPGATFVSRSVGLNALTAWVPAGFLERLVTQFPEVARVDRDGVSRALLDSSPATIGATSWWNAGYIGSSGTPIAILDTGVDSSHPALYVGSARVFHAAAQYDWAYWDSTTNPDDYYGHGTHVAGIAASGDSTYAGVAYGATLMNAKVGYADWYGGAGSYDSDVRAGGDWAANNGAVALNYSFGAETSTTDGSDDVSLFFDGVCFSLSIPVAISAGNSGSSSYTINTPGDAFNVITVGNFDDYDTTSASDDYLAGSSSRGPTSDGRRKPDLSAPGSWIRSSAADWEGSNPNFIDMSGTSMASPHVAGACGLLADYGAAAYSEGFKALLVGTVAHTSPYNTSPNDNWGFGALHVGRAYTYRASLAEGTLTSGASSVFLRTGALSSGGRVTLVWNRQVTSNGSSSVTTYHAASDLDLYVYDETTGSRVGLSDSAVNTVEQTAVSSSTTNPVVLVDLYGSLPSGVSTEYWAVAAESTSATTVVTAPSLSCTFPTLPSAVQGGVTFTVDVAVRNDGALRAFAPSVTLTLPPGYSILSGSNPQTLSNLAGGASATASWSVQSPSTSGGAKTFRAQASTVSYEKTFTSATASANQTLDFDVPTGTLSAPAYARQSPVVVGLSASDTTSSVTSMRLRETSGTWGPWTGYATTATVTLSAGDGTKSLQAEFRDAAGNVSAVASDSLVLDTVAPAGLIVVANGAEFVNDPLVSVFAAASDATSGVTQMRFSDDGAAWRAWKPYAAIASERVPADDGGKTLFAQFADAAGNLSEVVSDTVVLDTVAPSGTLALAGGAEYVGPWRPLTADLTLGEDPSGFAAYRYSADGGASWSAWIALEGTSPEIPLPAGSGDRALDVRVQVRDAAGNVSTVLLDGVHVLPAAPQDASRGKSVKGRIDVTNDVDCYVLDLVAGETLTVKVAARSATKRGEFGLLLDLHGPGGEQMVVGRHPAAATKAGIAALPIVSTGRYWLVARGTGGDAAAGGTYVLTMKVKSPAAVRASAGTLTGDPDEGVTLPFEAAGGWKVSATFDVPPGGVPTLVGPDGAEFVLPPLRRNGPAGARVTALLPPGAGTYRLVVPGAGPVEYALRLTPPRRGRVTEAVVTKRAGAVVRGR